jgi:hypothetical protein
MPMIGMNGKKKMRGSPPKLKGGLLPPANGGGHTGVCTAGGAGLSSGSGGAFPWWSWSRSAMVVATAELPLAAAHLVKKARREPKT